MHHADHAGDVEHGHHRQSNVVGRPSPPKRTGHRVVHDAFVRVHTPLGQPGGAAGVGQQSQVLRPHRQGGRFAGAGDGIAPGMGLALLQRRQRVARAQPVCPRRGRSIITAHVGIERIGELGDDKVRQALGWWQCITGVNPFSCQVARGDGDLGVGIGDVVLEFFGPVHRVDGHYHSVGPQNGKVRHHELRAVLHAQRHAIAPFHAQSRQIGGKAFSALLELTISQRTTKENQRHLVRITLGADGQVVPQRGGWNSDGMGQTTGPELVVRAHRANSLLCLQA